MRPDKHATISQIVRSDYRTADVFRKHGINYCCGGNATLGAACEQRQLNTNSIQKELEEAIKTVTIPSSLKADTWSIDFLVDYINHVHHAYLKQALPALESILNSFVKSHRNKYQHLDHLQEVFHGLLTLLQDHTTEEEEKIFPYIKQISHTHKHKEVYGKLFVKTLSRPLQQVVRSEHTHIAAQLSELRKTANHYSIPENACTNHHVVYYKLKELDADIVQQKHLENNVLFPKAIKLESELLHV